MAIEDVGKASKYRGVYTHQGKWMAKITALGTKHYLGFFNEEDEAAYAFNTAARFILREWSLNEINGVKAAGDPNDPEVIASLSMLAEARAKALAEGVKYFGVSWYEHYKKWQVKYKSIHMGYYEDQHDAARAYNNAATFALDTSRINTVRGGWVYEQPTKINPKLQALRDKAIARGADQNAAPLQQQAMSTNVQGLPHTTKRLPPRAPLAPRTKKASAPPPVDTTLPRGPDDLPAWRIVEQAWEVYEPHPRQGCTYPQHPTQAADLVSLLQGDGASTSKNTVVIYEDARQVTDNDWLRFYYRSGLPNVTDNLYDVLPDWERPVLDYSNYHPALDLYAEHSDVDDEYIEEEDVVDAEQEGGDMQGSEDEDGEESVWMHVGAALAELQRTGRIRHAFYEQLVALGTITDEQQRNAITEQVQPSNNCEQLLWKALAHMEINVEEFEQECGVMALLFAQAVEDSKQYMMGNMSSDSGSEEEEGDGWGDVDGTIAAVCGAGAAHSDEKENIIPVVNGAEVNTSAVNTTPPVVTKRAHATPHHSSATSEHTTLAPSPPYTHLNTPTDLHHMLNSTLQNPHDHEDAPYTQAMAQQARPSLHLFQDPLPPAVTNPAPLRYAPPSQQPDMYALGVDWTVMLEEERVCVHGKAQEYVTVEQLTGSRMLLCPQRRAQFRALREAAVADFKLDHRAWAMQRERGPQLRAAIEHAWALFRAGSPNDYFSEGDDEDTYAQMLRGVKIPTDEEEPQPPVDECEELDRLWSRALEFKARRGEFGRAGLTAMQRLDADRQRLVIQGGAMYAHEWLPRYISTGMGPMLPMGLDTVAMSGQRAMAGQRSVPMVVQCSVGNIPMPHVTLHDDSIKTHKDEEQPIDPVRGVGAYASKACLWGAEGSPEAVVEEWMQQLVSTDHAFVTLSPQARDHIREAALAKERAAVLFRAEQYDAARTTRKGQYKDTREAAEALWKEWGGVPGVTQGLEAMWWADGEYGEYEGKGENVQEKKREGDTAQQCVATPPIDEGGRPVNTITTTTTAAGQGHAANADQCFEQSGEKCESLEAMRARLETEGMRVNAIIQEAHKNALRRALMNDSKTELRNMCHELNQKHILPNYTTFDMESLPPVVADMCLALMMGPVRAYVE